MRSFASPLVRMLRPNPFLPLLPPNLFLLLPSVGHTAPLTHFPRRPKVVPFCPAAPDLKTMTERLRSRYYVTRKLFVADLQRVIANCREYNPPDSEYCRCASALEKFFYFKLKEGGLIDK